MRNNRRLTVLVVAMLFAGCSESLPTEERIDTSPPANARAIESDDPGAPNVSENLEKSLQEADVANIAGKALSGPARPEKLTGTLYPECEIQAISPSGTGAPRKPTFSWTSGYSYSRTNLYLLLGGNWVHVASRSGSGAEQHTYGSNLTYGTTYSWKVTGNTSDVNCL